MAITFLRRDASRYSKLGKNRKNKQKWKRPTGRDNKMREKRRGYPAVVSIGYQKNKSSRGTLQGKTPLFINTLLDLTYVGKDSIAVVGSVGKKKKLEIAQKAKEMNIPLHNLNPDIFLKKVKKPIKKVKKEEPKNKSEKNKK